MPAKNWRGKRHPGLVWRVLFGHNGPTKGELKKLLGLTFSKTFPVQERDAVTGRVRTRYMRIEADGRVVEAKAPVKKKRTPAKQPAAKKKSAARRTTSQPSKPSRASKSGGTPRHRQAAAPTLRQPRAEPMAKRFLQNPDGTMAGSRKQKPVTYAQAQREYAKAMKNAAAASKRAEELLGWQQPPSR